MLERKEGSINLWCYSRSAKVAKEVKPRKTVACREKKNSSVCESQVHRLVISV